MIDVHLTLVDVVSRRLWVIGTSHFHKLTNECTHHCFYIFIIVITLKENKNVRSSQSKNWKLVCFYAQNCKINYLHSTFFTFCFNYFATSKFETDLKRSSESEETWWCWQQPPQMPPPGPQLETEAHSPRVAFWQFSVKGIFEQCIYMYVYDLYL